MEEIDIYTDGACRVHTTRQGGWAAIIIQDEQIKELYGGYARTTSNRMEILAVIRGAQLLPRSSRVTVYTDSMYVVNAATRWMPKWQKRKYRGVKNTDLWKELRPQLDRHEVEFQWVRGHNGDFYNERADELAVAGSSLSDVPLDIGCTK